MTTLRDPRAFKVLDGTVTFPRSDSVLAAILNGDRPVDYDVDGFGEGKTIPPGRLPASAARVFLARGTVEVVAKPAGGNAAKTGDKAAPGAPTAKTRAPGARPTPAPVAPPVAPVEPVEPTADDGAADDEDGDA